MLAATQTRYAGTASGSWDNVARATGAPDSSCAGTSSSAASLNLTNYGFTIPAGSTITGISVSLQYTTGPWEPTIRLLKAGTSAGTARTGHTGGTMCPGPLETHGGGNDLWGTSWTVEEINSSNFGVRYLPTWAANLLDYASITVYYFPNSFSDVPPSHMFYYYIETIYEEGITAGCAAGNFCPDNPVTRAQMAIFLEKAKRGASYVPPAPVGLFLDVPTSHWAAAWIERLANDQITAGCGSGIYCPEAVVTRAQMAVFLLKAEHGSTYVPPAATGLFLDVPTSHWAAAWIEKLADEDITAGCGTNTYCPDNPVTRGQMAVFLTKTFGFGEAPDD